MLWRGLYALKGVRFSPDTTTEVRGFTTTHRPQQFKGTVPDSNRLQVAVPPCRRSQTSERSSGTCLFSQPPRGLKPCGFINSSQTDGSVSCFRRPYLGLPRVSTGCPEHLPPQALQVRPVRHASNSVVRMGAAGGTMNHRAYALSAPVMLDRQAHTPMGLDRTTAPGWRLPKRYSCHILVAGPGIEPGPGWLMRPPVDHHSPQLSRCTLINTDPEGQKPLQVGALPTESPKDLCTGRHRLIVISVETVQAYTPVELLLNTAQSLGYRLPVVTEPGISQNLYVQV